MYSWASLRWRSAGRFHEDLHSRRHRDQFGAHLFFCRKVSLRSGSYSFVNPCQCNALQGNILFNRLVDQLCTVPFLLPRERIQFANLRSPCPKSYADAQPICGHFCIVLHCKTTQDSHNMNRRHQWCGKVSALFIKLSGLLSYRVPATLQPDKSLTSAPCRAGLLHRESSASCRSRCSRRSGLPGE